MAAGVQRRVAVTVDERLRLVNAQRLGLAMSHDEDMRAAGGQFEAVLAVLDGGRRGLGHVVIHSYIGLVAASVTDRAAALIPATRPKTKALVIELPLPT